MTLKMISRDCSGGKCPTLYQSEEGTFYIQGYKTSNELQSDVTLSDNETLVEISADLIEFIKKS